MHIPLGTILALVLIIYLVGVVKTKNSDFVTAFSAGWSLGWKIGLAIIILFSIALGVNIYLEKKKREDALENELKNDLSYPNKKENPFKLNTFEHTSWQIDSINYENLRIENKLK